MRTRVSILLVAVAIFAAGLFIGSGGYVFAGDPVGGLEITIEQIPGGRVSTKNYSSSLSNKSVGLIRMGVGNILLGYGVGGAEINKVTDALEGGGVYEAELKSFLIAIGINEEGVQKILAEFDKIGIAKPMAGLDAPTLEFTSGAISAPAAGDTLQAAPAKGTVIDINPPKREISTPDAGDTPQPEIVHQELHRPPTKISVPDTIGSTGDTPQPATEGKNDGAHKRPGPAEVFAPDAGGASPSAAGRIFKWSRDNGAIELMQDTIGKIQERLKRCATEACITVGDHAKIRLGVTIKAEKAIKDGKKEEAVQSLRTVKKIIEGDIELLAGVEDKGSIADVLGLERALLHQTDLTLKALSRKALQEKIQTLQQNTRENAKELRDNFRENVKAVFVGDFTGDGKADVAIHDRRTGDWFVGKTARIAVAHGKGLRMVNRYRSAIARFDHILGRLESRVEKIRIEIEAEARAKGKIIELFPPHSVVLLIEEAKNMQVENEARLVQLEAKYESFLLGENSQKREGIFIKLGDLPGNAEEAREIAQELKVEIENLHDKLREISLGIPTVRLEINLR